MWQTGRPAAFPAMSHKAMSIALIVWSAAPARP
jgi:hypothetical protein